MKEWLPVLETLIISIVLPFVINLAKRSDWSTSTSRWFAYALSAAVAVLIALMTWPVTPETLITTALAVIGGTQVVYAAFKSIGVTCNVLEALGDIGANKDTDE